mmetsp:Transcript_61419/g.138381  ORF Transcript_61419/g.138381 Transcript_61419/m.138381 type:complete len:208 (-) Transcript_61419:593-1216(-)
MLASRQKSMTTGSPAFSSTGSAAPATVAFAPSLAARRMATFALVEHASRACFLPLLATTSRVSPKTLDCTSATFCSAAQVFSKPLSSLQPEPPLERFSRVSDFSMEAASSCSALATLLARSSAAANRLAGTTGSMVRAGTYMSVLPALLLLLLTPSLVRLSLIALSTPARRESSWSRVMSSSSAQGRSIFSIGTCFAIMGRIWPVLP